MKAGSFPSTSPKFPLAVLGLAMLGGLAVGPGLFREHRALDGELAVLRAAQSSALVKGARAPTGENAQLFPEYEYETALLRAAEAKALELGKALPRMAEEEWRSLGRVEELGWQAADFIGVLKNKEPRNEAEGGRFSGNMLSWMKRMEVIGEMEDDPVEIARLHTATLSTRMNLDDAVQERVRLQIEQEFSQLHEKKLTRPQRPDTERGDWYARRKTALNEAALRIEALIPPAQRQQFAVGQSLHLGTGLRTQAVMQPDGPALMSMSFELPGLDYRY